MVRLGARRMTGAADGRTRHDAQRRDTRQGVCQAQFALCLVHRQPVRGGSMSELAPRRPLFIGRVVLGRLEMRSLLRGGANTHSTFY